MPQLGGLLEDDVLANDLANSTIRLRILLILMGICTIVFTTQILLTQISKSHLEKIADHFVMRIQCRKLQVAI